MQVFRVEELPTKGRLGIMREVGLKGIERLTAMTGTKHSNTPLGE